MTKYTAFRCPEDLLAKAKIKARDDRRSLSNYLITLIEKDVADVPDSAIATSEKSVRSGRARATTRRKSRR